MEKTGTERHLNDRKKRLLSAIVKGYIETVEPIGSRTICKRYGFSLSPATIRNEMAELEEEGLLVQPHLSAGRIPSDSGYRIFVNQLMEPYPLQGDENVVLAQLRQTARALEAILLQSAKILSEVARCIAIVQAPHLRKNPIRALHILPIDQDALVLIVSYENGINRESVIRLSQSIYPETLTILTNYLNAQVKHSIIEELFHATVTLPLEREIGQYQWLLSQLIAELYSQVQRDEKVYLAGSANLLKEPEFSATEKAYPILNLLEKQQLLQELLSDQLRKGRQTTGHPPTTFQIGHENLYQELHGCSFAFKPYFIDSHHAGMIGLLGPTRMNYSRSVTMLEAMSKNLTNTLTNFFS